jgi:hypothetical protein
MEDLHLRGSDSPGSNCFGGDYQDMVVRVQVYKLETPEPATLLLVGTALCLAGALLRRRVVK